MTSIRRASSLRFSRNFKHLACLLTGILSIAGSALGQTVSFETVADLAPFTIQTADGTLGFSPTAGTGAPGGGGLTFTGITAGTDHSGILYRNSSYNANNTGVFKTSILINAAALRRGDGVKEKGEIRLGFVTATVISPSSPHEFFNKTNPGLSVKLSAEHQEGSADRKLEVEVTNFVTAEEKLLKKSISGASAFTNWLRLTFIAERNGSSTYAVSCTVEDCGPDGTSVPVSIAGLNAGPQTVINPVFTTDSSIYSALLVKPDKFTLQEIRLDEFHVEAIEAAPATPVALAATQVTSTSFNANWEAGPGVPAGSFIVEVTRAEDNFNPNTFISADGTGSHSSGIVVSAATTNLTISNLPVSGAYVYRIRAFNTVGTSAVSNAIQVTTIAGNAPPTLDAILSPRPIRPSDAAKSLMLTGISAGGESNQTVTLTAVSSAPGILPHPTISYTSPSSTATLTYQPTGAGSGDVTITVTANDGQSLNNTLSRSFTISVKEPQPIIGFESEAELLDLDHEPVNGTLSQSAGSGLGNPPGGGLVFEGTVSGVDRGAAVWRVQPYSGVTSTHLRASIFLNAREVDDLTSGDKGEIAIGFVGSTLVSTAKIQDFLKKTNPALSVKLKVEHDPSEAGKIRLLEAEPGGYDGYIEIKAQKQTLLNSPAVNNWLKLVFEAVKTGTDTYRMSYRVEDWGADGTAMVSVLMDGQPIDVQNATIANDPEIWAAFSVNSEKNGAAKIYLDQFEAVAEENPPITPVIANAAQITSSSFLARWQHGDGAYATGWILEVSTAQDNFAPGTLIGENGTTGQTSGIVVAGSTRFSKRITGLLPSTAYVYRVRATNQHGQSPLSDPASVTTLALGQNSQPTLDPIANPSPLNINASQQSIVLTGISAGGEADQWVTLTAVSSNPALIPDPFIDHNNPDETGTLYFTPNEGQTGTATITVTVDDDQSLNNTITRTFVIIVSEPQTLIAFNDSASLDRLTLSNYGGSTLAFGGAAGTGSPAGGGLVFSRSGTLESVAVGFRNTAYDARVAPFLTASIMVNSREIVGILSGKDKAELRMAFASDKTPNANSPKDTLSKTMPALGLTFKLEHEVGKADKDRKLEVELFSYNGVTEAKGSKQSALRVDAASNWLQVNLYLVRVGQDQYYLVFGVEDFGPNGTAWQGQVLTGGPLLVTNAPFFNDESVYAGFTFSPEKTSAANVYFDNFEVTVNTTAPDAPLTLSASDVRARQFTANWAQSAIGYTPDSYLLEISPQSTNFAPGTLISANGTGGQNTGITLTGSGTNSLTITGLVPSENYIYRVRAKRSGELSAIAGKTFVTTLPTDLNYWRETKFSGPLSDPAFSSLTADPDQDQISNLLEYALGLDPHVSDSAGLPALSTANGYLRLTFQRRRNAPDVIYIPEASGDLSYWSPNVTEIYVSPPDAAGMETVVVEDIIPISEANARYLRLRVQTLP